MSRRNKKGRQVNGVLLLDKPQGITSNRALQIVKMLYGANKAGHTGSLDPLATGMLPICFGEATKMSGYLLDANKAYQVTMKLGEITDSGDSDGALISESEVPEISDDVLDTLLAQFTGNIQQTPPMYSALKHEGQPLYKLARQGISVDRPARAVTIYNLEQLGRTLTSISLKVVCSKGTYIRSLVEDIGVALGCGAHVIELRRLYVQTFENEAMITIPELEQLDGSSQIFDALLKPMDCALEGWPKLHISSSQVVKIRQGQEIVGTLNYPDNPSELIRLYDENGIFIGLGQSLSEGRIAPKKVIQYSSA